MSSGLPAVAAVAQPSAVGWIVGVVACGYQLAPAEGPVVGVSAGLTAGLAVPVVLFGAHALRVTGQDARSEPGVVCLAVAALGAGAAGSFGLGLVLGAAATGREFGAASDGADGEGSARGHGVGSQGWMVLSHAWAMRR
jgi:hypothetical protein